MKSREIYIPRKVINQLLHQAQLSPTKEICGLIGSKKEIPTHCYPIANIAKHPERQFLLDPKQQITVMSKMREQGEELFAIYHSHPNMPAAPSQTDIDLASYPGVLYLIISLKTKGVLELRCYEIENNIVTELPLVLEQNA